MGDLYGLKHQCDMPRLRSEEVDDFKTAISQAFHSLCEFLSSSSIYIISYFLEKVKFFSVSLTEEPVVSGDHKKGFLEFLSHFLYILYHIFDKKSNFFLPLPWDEQGAQRYFI